MKGLIRLIDDKMTNIDHGSNINNYSFDKK